MKLIIFKNNLTLISNKLKNNLKKYIGVRKTYNFPFSREWRSSIYYYNASIMKAQNLINNNNINKLIRNFFLLSFKSDRFINTKHIIRKKRPYLLKNIFLSKVDIKYTSYKVIIRLFSYNAKRKYAFIRKVKLYYNYINNRWLRPYLLFKDKSFIRLKNSIWIARRKKENISNNKNILLIKDQLITSLSMKISSYIKLKKKTIKIIKSEFRTFKYYYLLNKYKFEKSKLLPLLTRLLNTYIDKKIEYNIITLKSIMFSPDLFTSAIRSRIKKKRFYIHSIINRVIKSKLITIHGRGSLNPENHENKEIDIKEQPLVISNLIHLIENMGGKYKSCLQINYILKHISFFPISHYYLNPNYISYNNVLEIIRSNTVKMNREEEYIKTSVFNEIKYKRIAGIKFDIQGRLTKRYRADRSYRFRKIKGRMINVFARSGFNLDYVKYRGFMNSNVSYSLSVGKIRIGSFGIKGWISCW